MKIHVTRNSVCMGDDVFDNSRDIEFATNAAVGDIISELNSNSFFPHVSGNDVMWAVENARKERILEYYTKSEKTVFIIPKTALLKDICGGKMTLHCVYYSSYE
ncbi:MAG: hypothetical protein K2N06_03620, partial [Oscillospiraceae bacterium]|nr:hypothetical protein [Oscillospiraceae bacterium]